MVNLRFFMLKIKIKLEFLKKLVISWNFFAKPLSLVCRHIFSILQGAKNLETINICIQRGKKITLK